MDKVILQKWHRKASDEVEMGIIYYSLLSLIKELDLKRREIQLLAFTAHRGTIASLTAKREFARRFDSSVATVDNMIGILWHAGYLVKDEGKVSVNKALDLDFSQDILLNIKLNGPKRQDN